MGKTNAERQREYRQRHLQAEDGGLERLNLFVSLQAKRQLERLAAHHGVTQRAALEWTLAEAERAMVDSLSADRQSAYYDGAPVTP
jgi:hypothetical protein